jgi:multicomponent Na+:H+ antiporter subunit F
MMNLTIQICFGGLILAVFLCLVRLARGPTLMDRLLAFDMIAISAMGMLVLLSIQWQSAFYLELILVFSLLGFLNTVAFASYLHRTDEPGFDLDEGKPRLDQSPLRGEREDA